MMNSVRCPICEQRIVAEDSAELSASLKGHLERRHDISRQRREVSRYPVSSTQERGVGTVRGPPTEGLKGAQHRREEQNWSPAVGSAVPPRPEGLGDWVRKSLGTNEEAGGREDWISGEGYPTMWQRSRPGPERRVMECPLCGRLIGGRDEDELSGELEEHFRMEHRIVPSVKAR